MSSLLPPNATSIERAVEAVTARAWRIPSMHRAVWDPETCPSEFLVWLAWSHSLDSWNPLWPEHIKRARIRTAIEVHRRKGTVGSVRQVIASFGGVVTLREWWQSTPPGPAHTFSMSLTLSDAGDGYTNTAAYVDDIIAEVIKTKPVRSHFTFTQGISAAGAIGILAVARFASHLRIEATAN